MLLVVFLATRAPDYAALRAQDEVGSGAIVDFEELYLAGRSLPIGPMHASPGDVSGVYVLLNAFAAVASELFTLFLGGLQPWGASGESWVRALAFAWLSSLQWFVFGSGLESIYRRVAKAAA